MRLFEVESRFTDDLVTVLRNMVGRSDQQHAPQILSYPALGNILKNFGYGEIDPATFKDVYDSSEELQSIVKDPSETGKKIVLKTKDERASQELAKSPGPDIDAMAHQGAQDYQSDISK